jgi:hypothetical protein
LDEDIGDRFANAVKFAFDGSRTPRVVEPSAATSELGRVPGVRPRCVRRVFLVAVGFAVTIAAIAFGHQIWRSFEVRTVVPSPYEIPKFGPTGALLNSLGATPSGRRICT